MSTLKDLNQNGACMIEFFYYTCPICQRYFAPDLDHNRASVTRKLVEMHLIHAHKFSKSDVKTMLACSNIMTEQGNISDTNKRILMSTFDNKIPLKIDQNV